MENKRKHDKRYCAAYGCLNSNKKIPDLSLFSLPKDAERRRQWLVAIGREDLLSKENLNVKSYVVCSYHFEDSAIRIIKLLQPNAVPTKFVVSQSQLSAEQKSTSKVVKPVGVSQQSEKAPSVSTSTQTENEEAETNKALCDKTTRKRKLSEDLSYWEHKRTRLQCYESVKKDLEAQNSLSTSAHEDDINRYDVEYKMLHDSSPHKHRYLQTGLKLPSNGAINKFKLKNPPKLDDQVLQSLSKKIKSLPQKGKYCTICVDEMVLKHNIDYNVETDEVIGNLNNDGRISPEDASNTYAIMLQGIYYKWKQPIAYAFLASAKHFIELDTWINNIIQKLCGVGVEVKAVVTNPGSKFNKYAKVVKKVTVEKPYFFVDEHKIYYIFDVLNLLQCIRNNLFSSDFVYAEKVISWDHIKTLYRYQKETKLGLLPNLKAAHVEPNNFEGMRVKYAAQIFSKSVSAALETYIDFGMISEDARATAAFIKTMADLIDIMNPIKVKSVPKFQTAFRMSANHKTVLEDAKNMFASIKSLDRNTGKDNTNQIRTFLNFQISIQSFLQLFQD